MRFFFTYKRKICYNIKAIKFSITFMLLHFNQYDEIAHTKQP